MSKTMNRIQADRDGALIETRNATLDTFSVTIQALHVGSRQMTLAVFRQLPEKPVWARDGTIRSNVTTWGTVRYKTECKPRRHTWGEGDPHSSDIWLVYSESGRLWRCPVYGVVSHHPEIFSHMAGEMQEELNSLDSKAKRCQWRSTETESERDRLQLGIEGQKRQEEIAAKGQESIDAILKLPQLFIAV